MSPPLFVLIQGGARGADALAASWATRYAEVRVITEKADWRTHGRAAGPIRNSLMLERYKPHCVVAFPGGKGTADMVSKAHKAGIAVVWATAPRSSLPQGAG